MISDEERALELIDLIIGKVLSFKLDAYQLEEHCLEKIEEYTKRIREDERRRCAESAENAMEELGFEKNIGYSQLVYEGILNGGSDTPQPPAEDE